MIRVVSLFCGIGGADLGLYRAAAALGIAVEVVAAYDSWDRAVAVYNANLPHAVAQVADVKQLAHSDMPEHDLVIGGPPCQPFSLAGKREGHDDPRNCLPDFMRLAAGSPWLMENVVPRLVSAPFSLKLNAFDFGDITTRKRWFYSDHLLDVIPTPGPLRIRDIRECAEDERVLAKRGFKNRIGGTPVGDDDVFPSLTAGHGGVSGYPLLHIVTHRPRTNEQGGEPYATIASPDGAFGSLTADAPRAYSGETLKIGLRGNSASASAFNDDEPLGSLLSNAYHANEASKLEGCRNPSILEMARAHSIPDSFDWCNATKNDKGKMIANSWPVGMAAGVCRAMLVAMGALQKEVA